jgi:hypothetical protein
MECDLSERVLLKALFFFPSRKKPWTGTGVRDVAWTVLDSLPAAKPLR